MLNKYKREQMALLQNLFDIKNNAKNMSNQVKLFEGHDNKIYQKFHFAFDFK